MQDSFQKFSQCMRDNGVDVPDIGSGGGPSRGRPGRIDQDDPDVQTAPKTCQSKLPQGAGAPGGGRPVMADVRMTAADELVPTGRPTERAASAGRRMPGGGCWRSGSSAPPC